MQVITLSRQPPTSVAIAEMVLPTSGRMSSTAHRHIRPRLWLQPFLAKLTELPVSFDIDLPNSGLGVESRSPGANGSHSLVLTFDSTAVSDQASVTAGVGTVQGQPTLNGNQVMINLTGVTNAQRITVTLFNLNNSGSNVSVSMGVLLGDTNGNGSVNATDVSQAKLKSGQTVDASNFREDITVNGFINSSDVSAVKLQSGTALP